MIERFGELNGRAVHRATLSDGPVSVSFLDYGAITQDWQVPHEGATISTVLGFERFEHYLEHSRSFGIIAGRVANRTAHGRFTLGTAAYQLATNNGPHHLHGGDTGLGRRIWNMEPDGARALKLTYHSPGGEDGYPGALDLELTLTLEGRRLAYDMIAVPDRPTPVNLAQHSYYDLGLPDIRGCTLWLDAAHYTPTDETLIPTGQIASTAGTHFDFRSPAEIAERDPKRLGIDLNMVLREDRAPADPAARLTAPNGRALTLWTDQPGIQLFNAPAMEIPVPGLGGKHMGPFSGLCLEAQKFPDALNKPQFPSIIATPEAPYRQRTSVEIT